MATMASRYTAEALLLLRQSPLCVKPPNLPPAEQWMGAPPDNTRIQQTRPGVDRPKTNDGTYSLDPSNRRPTSDRHNSRNASNPEDIVLGPPKMSFASASSLRNFGNKIGEGEKPFRDQEPRDRFGLRTRGDQADSSNYPGTGSYGNNNTDRSRDSRNSNFRRRGETDQDSDGWSTVKPRKSFGHEGAERFHGRMGGGGSGGGGGGNDRYSRDDRKPRDREEIDTAGRDRARRAFDRDMMTRDRDRDRDGGDDANDGSRRNGLGGRVPWFKDSSSNANDDRPDRPNLADRNDRASQRDRIDRTKNWRDRDSDNQQHDNLRDRASDRGGNGYDRRWDRDRDRDRDYFPQQRVEREPEWLDEDVNLAEEKPSGVHTEEDLRRFMDEMKGRGADAPKQGDHKATDMNETANRSWKADSAPAPAGESGPDRFFEQFSRSSKIDESSGAPSGDSAKDSAKAKSGKLSRFTSFFSSQEDTRRQTEPPTPATGALPQSPSNAGLLGAGPPPDAAEKEAFQALLQKLQRQTLQSGGTTGSATSPPAMGGIGIGRPSASNGTPPGAGGFQESPGSVALATPQEGRQKSGISSPDPPFPQPGMERRDDLRFRGGMPAVPPQQIMQDMLMQHPPTGGSSQSPSSSVRPEQMIQELLQRQQAANHSGGASLVPVAGGSGPNASVSNSQTEFLMKLMQSRSGPEARRSDELLMRMPQPQKQVSIPSIPDREAEMADFARDRDRIGPPRQQMRHPQGPPGLFADEQFQRHEAENRPPPQPTQILQRPPPPGLEHAIHGPAPPFLQQQGGGATGGRMQLQQQPSQQGPQQPMIPPPPGLAVNHPSNLQNRAIPNMGNIPMANIPNIHSMPPNMLSLQNIPNMHNMPMPNLPGMFPPNFSPSGPFPADGIPAGPPRNLHPPPPGFFGGPPGPPGFMPPPGMGFQGPPPDGVPFPFNDGRGIPQQPPPPGVGFRRP